MATASRTAPALDANLTDLELFQQYCVDPTGTQLLGDLWADASCYALVLDNFCCSGVDDLPS